MLWEKDQLFAKSLNTMQTHRSVDGVDSYRPAFMLSYDTADVLAERLGGRQYDSGDITAALLSTNNLSPGGRSTSPWEATVSAEGNLSLRWNADNPETMYPALDRKALSSGPVRSFAFFTGEYHIPGSHTGGSVVRESLQVSQRGAYGVLIYLVGTVGPKGSGADLELEAIEDWRPGRPIYLPGNELTLPFRVVRGMDHSPAEAGSWERDGPHGNIAVPGLNGLTNASFSASANSGGAYRAFNGWQGRRKTRASASQDEWDTRWGAETDFIGRDEDGWRKVEHWLQVDFGKVVTNLSSLCLRSAPIDRYGKPDSRWQSPYRFRVQTSDDGEIFTDRLTVRRADIETCFVHFPEKLSGRFVRLAFDSLWSGEAGDIWIVVSMIEINQSDG